MREASRCPRTSAKQVVGRRVVRVDLDGLLPVILDAERVSDVLFGALVLARTAQDDAVPGTPHATRGG